MPLDLKFVSFCFFGKGKRMWHCYKPCSINESLHNMYCSFQQVCNVTFKAILIKQQMGPLFPSEFFFFFKKAGFGYCIHNCVPEHLLECEMLYMFMVCIVIYWGMLLLTEALVSTLSGPALELHSSRSSHIFRLHRDFHDFLTLKMDSHNCRLWSSYGL